ncbi:MAG: T9SS type A sorting domain-containing protein, partial [Saprospiraceae bacterium]
NLYSLKAWGRIDNICVTEVNQACCTDEAAFIENAHNAVRLYASADGHEGIFDIGHLPACDSITFIDWGDGHVTQGPFGGDTRQKNYFINNIKTRVQYQVIEYNRDVDPAVPCFQHTFSDSLVVPRPGACACTAFSEIFIRGSEGEFSNVLGDDQVLQLHCLNTGSSYTVTGSFNCKGSGCASQTPVIWTITGPSGTFNGITYADNYFGITLLPAMMSDPGSYVLTLEGHCGGSVCNEIIPFNVQCPDNCPCTAQEISAFHDGVERGFAIVFRPDLGCIVQFAPLALNNCETVTWYLNNTLGTPIGESVGKESFAYTFSDAATYNVVMEVTKKKNDGSTCDKQMRLQQVTVTCQHAPDCVNSVIDNPGFSEGAVAGGLNSGGRSLGWNDLEGEPTVVEGLEGSLDGWTISLSGNHDTADVLSRFEPICLGKGTGLLTTTVKSAKFRGSERIFGGTLKIYLGRSLSFPPVGFSLDECNGINCFELATISLPVTDSAEWFEIQIPYDLSRWAAIDDCSGFSAVLIRPAIFVTNVLGSDQGGSSSYSSVQIDNFCFNEILVGVNNPPAKQTFRIYPNPNTGEFTVELKELSSQDLSLRIINLAGKNVMQKKFEEGKVVQNINAGQLSPGMYFLQIISEGRVISVNKIVIQ